jgi:hypothetical protein
LAKFWTSLSFSGFIQEFSHSVRAGPVSFDREAWMSFFADAWALKPECRSDMDAAEAAVLASQSPFALRLAELRSLHAEWPFVVGNLDIPAWLRVLSEDDDPLAAEVYFVISRGFAVLPPELASSFKPSDPDNYMSTAEHSEAVDKEIDRLSSAGFIGEFTDVCSELGLGDDVIPNVLSIGAVLKGDKIRIVIDPSQPAGESVNEASEPPDTVLPNVAMAMAALTLDGFAWKADFTDAFLHHVLHGSSVRLCCIRWDGKLYAYRRLGFGFRAGPSQQQSTTIAVVRALTRRLQRAGLQTAEPPAANHKYPHIVAKRSGSHYVNALLSFLDDVGGFSSSLPSAWFSFVSYLLLCRELSLSVALKPGKTDPPATLLMYLGVNFDAKRGVIFLDEKRLDKLRADLDETEDAEFLTVVQIQRLIGVLVFCSVVIRLGRVHCHV